MPWGAKEETKARLYTTRFSGANFLTTPAGTEYTILKIFLTYTEKRFIRFQEFILVYAAIHQGAALYRNVKQETLFFKILMKSKEVIH